MKGARRANSNAKPRKPRDSPQDSSDRLENDADGDLDLDQAYADPHRMTQTMRLLYSCC